MYAANSAYGRYELLFWAKCRPKCWPNGSGQKDRQGAPAILKGKPNAFRPSYLNLRTSTILNQQTGEKRANTAF